MELLQSVSNSGISSSCPSQICQAHQCTLCIHSAGWSGMSQILPGSYVTTSACAATTMGPPGFGCFKHRPVWNTALSLEVACGLEHRLGETHAYTVHTAHPSVRTATRRCNYGLVNTQEIVSPKGSLCENLPPTYSYCGHSPNCSIRYTLEFWALRAWLRAQRSKVHPLYSLWRVALVITLMFKLC